MRRRRRRMRPALGGVWAVLCGTRAGGSRATLARLGAALGPIQDQETRAASGTPGGAPSTLREPMAMRSLKDFSLLCWTLKKALRCESLWARGS